MPHALQSSERDWLQASYVLRRCEERGVLARRGLAREMDRMENYLCRRTGFCRTLNVEKRGNTLPDKQKCRRVLLKCLTKLSYPCGTFWYDFL